MKYIVTFLITIIAIASKAESSLDFQIKTLSGWREAGKYRIQYPVLTQSSYASQHEKKINLLLRKQLKDDYHCLGDPPKMRDMFFFTSIQLTHVSHSLLSLKLYYDNYCGGPHPNKGVSYYIFDLKTPRLVDLEDEAVNKKKLIDFLYKTFLKQVPKNYLQACRPVLSAESKDYLYPMFLLEKGKIIVRQDYPFVTKACEFDIRVPCKKMTSFFKRNGFISQYCTC